MIGIIHKHFNFNLNDDGQYETRWLKMSIIISLLYCMLSLDLKRSNKFNFLTNHFYRHRWFTVIYMTSQLFETGEWRKIAITNAVW